MILQTDIDDCPHKSLSSYVYYYGTPTCLGHLMRRDTNKMFSICVPLYKSPKASKLELSKAVFFAKKSELKLGCVSKIFPAQQLFLYVQV